MGLAIRGLTHCEKCGKTLNYDEYVLCRSCEKEKEGGLAMTKEQTQKILDELQEVRPEKLNNEAKKLFEAIMKIADERDSLKIKVVNQQERIDYLMRSIERKEQSLIEEHEENIECYTKIEEKDKIIDLTAEYISNITDCPFESEGKYLDCEKMCDVRTDKECWKQYFENKAKEVK